MCSNFFFTHLLKQRKLAALQKRCKLFSYRCWLLGTASSVVLPRPIILFVNIDISRHILVVDTSIFAKSNMGRREW
jgi:hypothetical protein